MSQRQSAHLFCCRNLVGTALRTFAHPNGAMYAGYFILKHPDLIKGVIFVDPVPRDFDFSNQLLSQYAAGIMLAKKDSAVNVYKKYNGSDVEVIYQLLGFDQSKKSLKKLGGIPNAIPVTVISSTGMEKEQPLKEDWYVSQQQWLNKNSSSKIIQVSSGHFVQLQQPKIVCDAIRKLSNY